MGFISVILDNNMMEDEFATNPERLLVSFLVAIKEATTRRSGESSFLTRG